MEEAGLFMTADRTQATITDECQQTKTFGKQNIATTSETSLALQKSPEKEQSEALSSRSYAPCVHQSQSPPDLHVGPKATQSNGVPEQHFGEKTLRQNNTFSDSANRGFFNTGHRETYNAQFCASMNLETYMRVNSTFAENEPDVSRFGGDDIAADLRQTEAMVPGYPQQFLNIQSFAASGRQEPIRHSPMNDEGLSIERVLGIKGPFLQQPWEGGMLDCRIGGAHSWIPNIPDYGEQYYIDAHDMCPETHYWSTDPIPGIPGELQHKPLNSPNPTEVINHLDWKEYNVQNGQTEPSDTRGAHEKVPPSLPTESVRPPPAREYDQTAQEVHSLPQQRYHHHQLRPEAKTQLVGCRKSSKLRDRVPPSVVGSPGMPKPAPRPGHQRLKLKPKDDALILELKETHNLGWKQIADFIHAVMKKYEALGIGMLRDLYRPNSTITLKDLINEFSITTSNSPKDTSYGRSHATLGITKDTEPSTNLPQGPQTPRSRSSSSRPRKPCSDITSKPESRACKSRASCNVINPALRPSKQDRNNDWQTYFNNYVQWCKNHEEGARTYIKRHNDSELKEILEKDRPRSTDRGERSVVAVTISSSAIALATRSTINLADRWGLDTCSDIHVVNNPSKADFTPTRQPPANLKLDVSNTSLLVVAIGNC